MSFLDTLFKDPFRQEGGYHMRGNPWSGRDGERFRWQGKEE